MQPSQSIVLVPTVHRTYGNPICLRQFDTEWFSKFLEILQKVLIWWNDVFPRKHWSKFWTSSSVTVECRPWPLSSCTLVRPSLNFLHHSLTQLSLITLSPYTRHNRRWISASLRPSTWRKRITTRTLQLAGADMISVHVSSVITPTLRSENIWG